jgi:hypothetical protein
MLAFRNNASSRSFRVVGFIVAPRMGLKAGILGGPGNASRHRARGACSRMVHHRGSGSHAPKPETAPQKPHLTSEVARCYL